jgi:hypothetical protein
MQNQISIITTQGSRNLTIPEGWFVVTNGIYHEGDHFYNFESGDFEECNINDLGRSASIGYACLIRKR